MSTRWLPLMGLLLLSCEGAGTLDAAGSPGDEEHFHWYLPEGLDEAVDEEGAGPVSEPGTTFARLALRWDAAAPLTLSVRGRDAAGGWTGWIDVAVVWSEEGLHVGAADLPRESVAWQVRVQPPEAAEAVAGLEVEAVPLALELEELPPEADDGEAPLPDLGEVWLEPELTTEDLGESHELKNRRAPRVVSRASWGARAPRCGYGNHRPNRITIHHTVTPTHDSMSAPARVRQIQAFHQQGNGWCDIGYHYLISRDGRIFQGRPQTKLGSHVGNNNTGNVGISLLGNFETGRPSDAQLRATAQLVDWLGRTYGIPRARSHVKGHRQYGGTACPGRNVYSKLDSIVAMARSGRYGGNAGGGNAGGGNAGGGNAGGGNAAPAPPPAPREGVLTGVVYIGNDTNRRVAGASVRLSDGKTTRTDANGVYRFRVAPGRYSVRVTKDGFQARNSATEQVRAGHTRWASVGLSRAQPPAATGRLVGVVYRHPDSAQRIAGAEVRLSNGRTVRTNQHGVYRVDVPVGDVRITASKAGFRQGTVSRTVRRGQEVWGSVGLRR